MARSDLPFGKQFSPSQIDLPDVLKITHNHEGDLPTLEATLRDTYFATHGGSDPTKAAINRQKLAMNCRLGLQSYGLLDDHGNLTAVGSDIATKTHDLQELYKTFARHILLNLNGMRVIQCVQELEASGERIKLERLEKALRERGMNLAKLSSDLSSLRLWLEKAEIVSGKFWRLNSAKLKEVLGTDPENFPALSDLSPAQRAFLRALANTGVATAQAADSIRNLAENVYGVAQPGKDFAAKVLKPLETEGWISIIKGTSGRGAKSAQVAPTARVQVDLIEPLLDQLKGTVDIKLLELLRKPLSETLAEMDSADTYVSGLALEALAFRLMRLLDMRYVDTRLRAERTGGAEVDLIVESTRLVFSRWQVQCKNYSKSGASVRVDDVAKEVGLTHMLKSNVIVVVTTGKVGDDARDYSNLVMRDTNLAIVLMDGQDIKAINEDPTSIVDVLRREAERAMTLKKLTRDKIIHG